MAAMVQVRRLLVLRSAVAKQFNMVMCTQFYVLGNKSRVATKNTLYSSPEFGKKFPRHGGRNAHSFPNNHRGRGYRDITSLTYLYFPQQVPDTSQFILFFFFFYLSPAS